jgi:hypothetical protein
MPDIMNERDVLKSDIFAYRSVKNELEKYDSGRESGLSSEHADLAVDSAILKMIEENKINTDPISLRSNFDDLLEKFSRIFGSIKQYMITLGQNLTLRQQIYDDFEKVHPSKLVQFHKAPFWYQSLVEIASAGGRIATADLIEMYPDSYQRLVNLSQDHGFIKYERGGQYIKLREDVCREILFREYATPTTPAEVRNKEYFKKKMLAMVDMILEYKDHGKQVGMANKMKDELMDMNIRDHVTLEWIAPLIRANIKTIDDFIETPLQELCKIVSSSKSEVSRSILSMVCFFKRDVKILGIDVFDRGIFKKFDINCSDKLTQSLMRNNINTWNDLIKLDILSDIKDFTTSTVPNYYRLKSFFRWFKKIVEDGDGFYYKPIIEDFDFHNHLYKNDIIAIEKYTKKTVEDYLKIDPDDEVTPFEKGNLARTAPKPYTKNPNRAKKVKK